MARVRNEILSSYCFSLLRKKFNKMGANFDKFAESKIIPVTGDLIIDKLGLSDSDRAMIVDSCNIILNSAASVNFDDPLKEALQINYFGSMRMLELAKECKNLEVFTHVSTCYVNCNRSGYVEEKVYDTGHVNVDELVSSIMNMNP